MKSSVPSSDEIEARLHNSLKNRPGVILWLDIVNKCNLRCIMCHFSNDDVFHKPVRCFTPEEFNKFFLDIAPYVREINLSCGAEPLTSKYFPEILSIVSDYPIPIEISDGNSLSEIFFGEGFRQLRHNMYLPEGDPGCRRCPVKANILPTRSEGVKDSVDYSKAFLITSKLKRSFSSLRILMGCGMRNRR